jgi:hypothetical protein
MKKLSYKFILFFAIFLVSHAAFSQKTSDKKKSGRFPQKSNEKNSVNVADTSITNKGLTNEKPSESDDLKRPLTKEDLGELTSKLDELTERLNNLTLKIEGVPGAVDAQYTKMSVLQDSLSQIQKKNKALEKTNQDFKKQINDSNNQLQEALQAKESEKTNSAAKDLTFEQIVKEYIMYCERPNNSTLVLMSKQLPKSAEFSSTNSKLEEFKKQSAALERAAKLIKNISISENEFKQAKLDISTLSVNTEFLGLQEYAKRLANEYDHFIKLALKLEEVINDNIKLTNPKYREDPVYNGFEKYIDEIKPYPFLEKKFAEAQIDYNCKLNIPLK